jgi:hypothetical protein
MPIHSNRRYISRDQHNKGWKTKRCGAQGVWSPIASKDGSCLESADLRRLVVHSGRQRVYLNSSIMWAGRAGTTQSSINATWPPAHTNGE